jgi:hypothetical protein
VTLDEQIETLQGLTIELKIKVFDIRSDMGTFSATLSQIEERLVKLEQAQCGRVSKAVERPPLEFPPEYYEKDADELTGSVDGVDATVRVKIQSPEEHARAKKARAGNETRTPVVEWEECGRH